MVFEQQIDEQILMQHTCHMSMAPSGALCVLHTGRQHLRLYVACDLIGSRLGRKGREMEPKLVNPFSRLPVWWRPPSLARWPLVSPRLLVGRHTAGRA